MTVHTATTRIDYAVVDVQHFTKDHIDVLLVRDVVDDVPTGPVQPMKRGWAIEKLRGGAVFRKIEKQFNGWRWGNYLYLNDAGPKPFIQDSLVDEPHDRVDFPIHD